MSPRFLTAILTVFVATAFAAAAASQDNRATSLSDEICRALEAGAPRNLDNDTRWNLKPDVQKLIADHLPESGDLLLSLIEGGANPMRRLAVNAFVATWDTMSNEQVGRYLQGSLIAKSQGRPKYPRGVGAMIQMGYQFRYGWGSRPASDKLRFLTTTTHFLNGRRYGDSFRYPYASSGCVTGWIQTKNLALGPHTVWLIVEYTAGEGARQVSGSIRSETVSFEMLPEDTPDDLIAPSDPKIDKLVRKALRIAETEEALHQRPLDRFHPDLSDPWQPQITWKEKDNTPNGLHVPEVELNEPLPVDLCFAVRIRIEATGEEFEGDQLIVIQGTKRKRSYFSPRETLKFCKGRSGFVPVRVILNPSRALALTYPKVTQYFPGEIVSDVLRIKIGPAKEENGATVPLAMK